MMQEALFILTVLGCDNAGNQCETITTEQAIYASVDACYESSEDLFIQNEDATYPLMMVRCDAVADALPQVASRPIDQAPQAVTVSAESSEPKQPGVWYRVGPRERIANVVEPIRDGAGDVASAVRDGAGNVASRIRDRAANAWDRTTGTVRRISPFD